MDITVIIPAYNRIWSLPKAIESCKDSSVLKIQIIVVDDGSTDNTPGMLSGIMGIEIYRQQHWGKPWAVNMAFGHAKGKYIKFLDSDDWLPLGSLDKQFQLAEESNADIVVAGYDIYENEKPIRTQAWTYCDDFIAQNLGECDSSHYSAFLFRKTFIADVPHRTSFAAADFASRDDRCFMLEVALKEPQVAIYNNPALCHLHHYKGRLQFQNQSKSACTNYQHLLIYKNIIKQLKDSGRLTQRRINAAIKILWPLAHWIAVFDLEEAVSLYKWLLELDPNFQIPVGGIINSLYRNLGFKTTEQLLSIRRALLRR